MIDKELVVSRCVRFSIRGSAEKGHSFYRTNPLERQLSDVVVRMSPFG